MDGMVLGRREGAVRSFAIGHGKGRLYAAVPIQPRRNLPLDREFVALALAEDARSESRQGWVGLGLAAGMIALFLSGAGIPMLAVAFCLAPVIGIGLELMD